MNKQILALAATTLAILPLGVNAAQNQLDQNSASSMSTNQIAQNYARKASRGDRIEKLLQKLDLTSQQSEQITAIREQFEAENEALYEEMRTNKEEMRSLFTSDASSEQLRQQHNQSQELRQQIGNNRFEMMLQIREVLTPEQREQMAQIMMQRNHRRS